MASGAEGYRFESCRDVAVPSGEFGRVGRMGVLVLNGGVWAWRRTTLHIPKVNHKVRMVIVWNHRRDDMPRKILVTNRTTWEVCRVLRTYRHRWTGTETYHRDGKQQLGMGDCQLRNGQGQTRHMYLVMLAYSLLMVQLRQGRARDWALCRLKTIGEACRAMLNETLRATLAWVVEQVREYGNDAEHVFARLRLT